MIHTLIVDDSALARDILRDFLEADGNFKIIGEAADGEEGIEKILSMNPDLVTLDVEMPKKTGLEVIKAVMQETFVPIVVISSQDTAKTAYEATLLGALEFYAKDTFTATLSPEKQKQIYETLKRISSVKAQRNYGSAMPETLRAEQTPPVPAQEAAPWPGNVQDQTGFMPHTEFHPAGQNPAGEKRKIDMVVIASSTGGPKALSKFVSFLPENFPVPIVIVQHNSTGFDKSFAQWLDTHTALKVKVAEEGEIPRPGTIYIAQTDKHLLLQGSAGKDCILCYNDDEPDNNQKPAANILFKTAAQSLKQSVISVVLTGMGSDGASGTQEIRKMGGITLAQDEETSLIYGMPKAAAETGCVDKILPLEKIPEELIRLTQ
jgi:two-component system chemotaxis response regulator CheB